MIKKISVAFMLSGLFSVGTGYLDSTVSAMEPEVEEGIIKVDETQAFILDGSGRSWDVLHGQLSGSKPLLSKPRATASSSTQHSVSAIRARVNSNNNGTGTSSSGWNTQNNTTLARSSQLIASTYSARFTGNHQARVTSNGSWQSTRDTSISF